MIEFFTPENVVWWNNFGLTFALYVVVGWTIGGLIHLIWKYKRK